LHSYDAANDHEHHHQHSNGLMIDRHQEKLLLKASLRKERDIKEKSKNIDGSYQCPFCDKSFPRLGYLKKHEQVSGTV
jgi:Zinc finger, C2H2 type